MSGGSTCIGKGGINKSGGRGDQHAWGVYMLGGATCFGGATCLAEGVLHAWQRGGYMLGRGGDYMLGRVGGRLHAWERGGFMLGKGRGDYFSSSM